MRILICGSRDASVASVQIKSAIEFFNPYMDCEIVTGDAAGADAAARSFCDDDPVLKIPLRVFKADWEKHGKAAGPIRNREMVDYVAQSDRGAVIAFWDMKSRGTKSTLDYALERGLPRYVYNVNNGTITAQWKDTVLREIASAHEAARREEDYS